METKKNFYFTFGQNYRNETHPNFPDAHPDGWVTIIADDFHSARTKAVELFGVSNGSILFAFQYDDTDFKPNFYPKGEIGCFKVE